MLKNLNISFQLYLLVFIISAFIIGVGAYGISGMNEMHKTIQTLYKDRIVPINKLAAIRGYYANGVLFQAQQANLGQISYNEALEQIEASENSKDELWEAYLLTYLTPEEKVLVGEASVLMDQSKIKIVKLKDILKRADKAALHHFVDNELFPLVWSIRNKLSELINLQVNVSEELLTNSMELYHESTRRLYTLIMLSLLFWIPLTYYLVINIKGLVKNLKIRNQEIIENETKIRTFFEHAGDGIVIIGMDSSIHEANTRVCEMMGYTREELFNLKVKDFYPPDEPARPPDPVYIQQKDLLLNEARLLRKDGTKLEVEINRKMVPGIGYLAIIRDITERKVIQKQLKEYQHFFENSNDIACIASLQGNIEIINPQFEQLLGYSKEELDENRFFHFVHPDDLTDALVELKKVVKGEFAKKYTFRFRNKNGNYLWIEWNVSPDVINGKLYAIGRDVTVRKKIEQELAEQKIKLTLFIEHSPASLAMFDNEMRYIATSRRWAKDYHIETNQIIGKSHYEVFPNVPQRWKDIHQRCLKGAIEKNEEDSYIRSDGSKNWVRWEIHPWHDASGEIGGIIMFTEVITERIRAEEKLKESSKLISEYRQALDESSIVSITDPNGLLIHVNDNFARISKYPIEELIGQPIGLLNSGHHPKEFFINLWQRISLGQIWKGEVKNKAKDGTLLWLDTTIIPFMGEDGNPLRYMAICADITERKKFEDELELMASIVNSSDDAIISKTLDGTITSWNHGAENILGYAAAEVIGRNLSMCIPPELHNEKDMILEKILEGKSIDHYETQRVRKDGEIIDVSLTISPIRDELGTIIGSSKIMRDITEKKRTEHEMIRYNRELKKTNSELDRFVYSTSHDLRAPLKSMLGLIGIIDDGVGPEDTSQHERLEMLNNSVVKLDNFIEEILLYSRNTRTEIITEVVNFNEMLLEICGSHKFLEGSQGLDLKFEVHSKEKFVNDKRRLGVILNNLISNAIKYSDFSKKDPYVKIAVTIESENAIIVVEDNGIGIAEADREKIFEMFYRATTRSTGSGLGMYILKETLEKLDGVISVESELKKGTKFTLTIPNLLNN